MTQYTKTRKAGTKNSNAAAPQESAQDRALTRFADMLIEKIESLDGTDGWQKPWFTHAQMAWPKSLTGRPYNGMNALMLMMHCEQQGYKVPVFATFDRILSLNYSRTPDGQRVPLVGSDLRRLPNVSVRKGEKSFPVFITVYTVVDADGHKVKYDDYRQMSEGEKARYRVYPKWQVYNVFNVAQTNIEQARPELWQKLQTEYATDAAPLTTEGMFVHEPTDRMIAQQSWICLIRPTYGDRCCFSLATHEITVPEKRQFKDGEAFYGNLWHEMAHSTTLRLDRIKDTTDPQAYAVEELVAELTAALVGQHCGVVKHLSDDSAPYLKGWLRNLREQPAFIKTVLLDVKRAARLIIDELDRQTAQAATAA